MAHHSKRRSRSPAALPYNSRMDLTLPELEQAINYWRALRPSTGEEHALSPEVNVLADVYAMMIYNKSKTVSLAALDPTVRQLVETWLKQRP